jgi:hypothetical protein
MLNPRMLTGALAIGFMFTMSAATASAQTAATSREGKATVEVRNPTPAELKKLADQMPTTSEDDSDLNVVTLKNGTKYVDLKGKFQSLAVAKKNDDGSVSVKCVESEKEKAAFLNTKTKAQSKRATKE